MTLASYALLGLVAGFFIKGPVFWLSVYLHAVTFLAIGMFVIATAGDVLFNKDENDILLHRPVTPAALLWAKTSVLIEVSIWIAAAVNLAGLWVGLLAPDGGWRFLVVHAGSVVIEALLCASGVVLLYELCFRWLGRAKLDGLITTTQILVSVAILLGSQLAPRAMRGMPGQSIPAQLPKWMSLLPPVWFASFDDALAGSGRVESWGLGAVAPVMTAVISWLAFSRLAGAYGTGLQTLTELPERKHRRSGRGWLSTVVSSPPLSWWLRNPVERASFQLTAAYLFRDRDVRLRVFPSLIPFVVMPIIPMLRLENSAKVSSYGLIFSGFLVGMVPLLAVDMLRYSRQWRAADLFLTAPLSGPADLCHGTRRAVICFLGIPAFVILATLVLFLERSPAHVALIAPGLIALPLGAILPSARGTFVPFSEPFTGGQSMNRLIVLLGISTVAAVLAGVAEFSSRRGGFFWFLLVEAVAVSIVYFILRTGLDRTHWRIQRS